MEEEDQQEQRAARRLQRKQKLWGLEPVAGMQQIKPRRVARLAACRPASAGCAGLCPPPWSPCLVHRRLQICFRSIPQSSSLTVLFLSASSLAKGSRRTVLDVEQTQRRRAAHHN